MAEGEGFEPPQTESESGVLPLHKPSISATPIIIRTIPEKSSTISRIFVFLRLPGRHSLPGSRQNYSAGFKMTKLCAGMESRLPSTPGAPMV